MEEDEKKERGQKQSKNERRNKGKEAAGRGGMKGGGMKKGGREEEKEGMADGRNDGRMVKLILGRLVGCGLVTLP